MDINAFTEVTLPSGDTTGITYFIGSTNATATSPVETSYFFLSNPGSFAVTGTTVVAAQGTLGETPAELAFATDRPTEIYFTYNVMNEAHPLLTPGANFTCTIFDGKTLIGSATTTVGGSTTGGVTNGYVQCVGVYPNNVEGPSDNGNAYVNIPATYNSADVYTFIISQ